MDIQQEHQEMVNYLAKSGDRILSNLTPERVHRMHMAVGMSTEGAEILEAVDGDIDIDNLIEELGDMEFYLEGFRRGCGFSRVEAIHFEYNREKLISGQIDGEPWHLCIRNLAKGIDIETGNALDLVKKEFCYNKMIIPAAMLDVLARLEFYLDKMRWHLKVEWNYILEHNLNKLLKSDNARYKNGYSDAAANARADKA